MFFAILFQCLPYNHKNPFYPKMSYFENFHWTKKYFLKFSTFSTFQIVVPPTKQPIAQSETGNGNRKKRPGKALYVPKALRDKPKPSGGTEEVRFQFHVNFIWRKINNDFIFFRENRVLCHMLLLPKLFLKWKHGKMRLKVKLVPFK